MRPARIATASCLIWATLLVSAGSTRSTQPEPADQQTGEYKPPPPPEQPIPYSHRTHLALGLQCLTCHETAERDALATLPPTATCMGCHAGVRTDSAHIQTLKAWDDKKAPVPWRRVYRLPDFVYFSHTQHVTGAAIGCDTCHGDVAQMDRMQKVKDISMPACIECHKSRSAPVQCDSCHEVL
jgi:hypothetical protein